MPFYNQTNQELTGAELDAAVEEDDGLEGFGGDFGSVSAPAGDTSRPGNWGGVYTDFPAAMPKHHPGVGVNTTRTSQARMWLPFADRDTYRVYKGLLSERSQRYVDALSTFLDGARGVGFVDFFLQSVNETYQEKVQVSEVLSDGYIAHFFGQRAPMWGYSGIVLNTRQNEWYDIWHILYEDVLRGTKLADARLPVRIAYDTRVVSGSLVNMSTSFNAPNETFATLQFQLLVRDVKYSPSSASRSTNLVQSGLGSTAFESADVLVTTLYSGLTAARDDFIDEAKTNEDLYPGYDQEEVKEKAEVDTQAAVESTEKNQSTLDDEKNYSSGENPDSVEGTGADVSTPAYSAPNQSVPIQ